MRWQVLIASICTILPGKIAEKTVWQYSTVIWVPN